MDYSATLIVNASPTDASDLIRNRIASWWTEAYEPWPDGFTVHFGPSFKRFRIDDGGTELAFSWTCVDAQLLHEAVVDPREWVGTRLVWSIAPHGAGSRVTLTHEGLTERLSCHEICVSGWSHFFEGSLQNYLNGQKPLPFAA